MKIRRTVLAWVVLSMMLLAAGAVALAHQTKEVGDGKYRISVGFRSEPIYTDELNGPELIVRTAEGEPVEHLQDTLFVDIIAPDGVTKRELAIRAVHGQPGRYTADIVLTQPGLYKLRIWGYIYDVYFDEVFELHEVQAFETLRFPK